MDHQESFQSTKPQEDMCVSIKVHFMPQGCTMKLSVVCCFMLHKRKKDFVFIVCEDEQ